MSLSGTLLMRREEFPLMEEQREALAKVANS